MQLKNKRRAETSASTRAARLAAVARCFFAVTMLALFCGCAPTKRNATLLNTPTPLPDIHLDAPSELSSWPWRGAKRDAPHRGVTH